MNKRKVAGRGVGATGMGVGAGDACGCCCCVVCWPLVVGTAVVDTTGTEPDTSACVAPTSPATNGGREHGGLGRSGKKKNCFVFLKKSLPSVSTGELTNSHNCGTRRKASQNMALDIDAARSNAILAHCRVVARFHPNLLDTTRELRPVNTMAWCLLLDRGSQQQEQARK